MNQRLTMGQPIGVKRLLEVVNMSQGPFTRGELDTMLRDGSLSVKDSLPVWWSEVNNFIGEVWGDTLKRFSRVIVVGGGSILLKDHLDNRLKVAKKVHYPANLVHSIGDGLYKLLLNQEGQK